MSVSTWIWPRSTATSSAPGEEVGDDRLADGEDHRVGLELDELALHGDRRAPAALVGLAQSAALELHAGGDAARAEDLDRDERVLDVDLLFLALLDLLGRGRRRALVLDAGEGDFVGAAAERGAAGVVGDVAAADHDDALAGRGALAERLRAQELDGAHDALLVEAVDRQVLALVQAGRQEDGLVAVGEQRVDGEVRAAALPGLELDAQGGDAVDLALQRRARQAVLGDADAQHAAGDRESLEHGRLVAELRELARGGEACGAAADDRDGLVVEHRQRRGQLRRRAVVGDEALDAGDGDRVLDVAARALGLADVRADAAADAGEGVRLAGDPVGLLVAALGDQRHVPVSRRVDRAGGLARAPALAVDGERRRDGVGERPGDRRPFADAEVELVGIRHGAHRGAFAAADALLVHVARPVPDGHVELAGRSGDGGDVRQRVDVDAAVGGGAGQPGREAAHGAVLGRERLAEPGHVAADALLALDEMDLDARGGELLGGGDAGDAAADHQHRAVEEGALARQVAHVLQAGDGALDDLPRLDLRALGLVRVHVGAALADVAEGHGVLAQLELPGDALEGGALEARRARGDDEVVEAALFHGLLDHRAAFGAAHELVDVDLDDAVERARVLGQRLEVHDAADVAAALAEEDSGPHRAPPGRGGAGADALEERLDILGVRLDADHLLGVGAQRQRQELLHVQVHEGELLAGALGDDLAVAVELDVAVGAHVHEDVDLLLGQPVQLLLRHPDGDRRVDEAVAEAGPAVRLLLVVGAGADDAGGDEHLLRHHEVLVVAERLVGEDLAVVAGGVGGDLDAVEAAPDELGDAVVGAPQDLEGVLVLHGGGDAVVVLAADLAEHLVGLRAVAGDVEDVARLLVDRVAGGAEVAHHRVLVVDDDAGVARGDADSGLDRHEVGVVAEAGAAGLRRVDRVLDAEALEEPLGGRLDAGVLGGDEAAAEQRDAPVDARHVGSRCEPFSHGPPSRLLTTSYYP